MKSSESIAKLAAALSKAQSSMGGAVKDSANLFFKSKYADLSAVMKAIKEPLSENGLAVMQFPVGGKGQIGVRTRVMHTSGEWIEDYFTAPMPKVSPQDLGSCITYYRRYALASVFGIPQVDDDAEASMFQARKTLNDWIGELAESITAIKQGLAEGDLYQAAEAWFELSDEEKSAIFVAPSKGGPFTTQERETMKSSEFRKAYYPEAA